MRRVAGLWLAAMLCFIAALLSKPNSVILPPLALLLGVVLWTRHVGKMCLILSPWFAAAVALVVFTARVQLVAEGPRTVAFASRFLVSSDAMLFYLRKLLIPLDFAIKYGRTPEWLVAQPWAFLTLLCPLVLGIGAWRLRKRCWPVLALGWTVIALVPNLGLIPFGFQQYSTVSDRYFYIAMVGPAMVLAAGFVILSETRMRRIARLAAVAGLVGFGMIGFLSSRQVRIWSNSDTLLTHAVAVNPLDTWSYLNLGRLRFEAGDLDAAGEYAKAALVSDPTSADAYFGLASVRRFQKQRAEAMRLYRLALKYNPHLRTAHLGLAAVLEDAGRDTEALREYEIIVRDYPQDFKAAALGGQILLKQGNLAEAEKYAAQAVASAENYAPGHLLMGQVQRRQGNDRAAMESLGRALQLDPSLTKARLLMSELLVKDKLQLQALTLVREGLQINPGDTQLQRELTRLQSVRRSSQGVVP
jgi:tetratricopeptide (TPR) repeat protein